MGRSKRGKKLKTPTKDEEDLSEDEGPNPESDEFFHDSVDKFNLKRTRIIPLDSFEEGEIDRLTDADSIEDAEDVMGLNLPDSEDEDDDGEEEENDDDDDDDDSDQGMKLPNEKSWGKSKAAYYSTDTAEAEADEDALELEQEEEEEALSLQKRLAAGLDEEDFDPAGFEIPHVGDREEKSSEDDEVATTVVMDLTKLSKEQKLEILFRESPELFELLDQFKEKLEELVSKVSPLMQLSKSGKLPTEGSKYVELKYRLYLNYCINIGFYLLLKSKQTPVKDHPVIGRIVQYRNLIKELEPLDKKLESDIEVLLANKDKLLEPTESNNVEMLSKAGKPTKVTKAPQKKRIKNMTPKSKLSALLDDSDEGVMEDQGIEPPSKKIKKTKLNKDGDDLLGYYEKVRLEKKRAKEMKNLAARLAHEPELELDGMDDDEDGKRAITYQISKNKGLTVRRKKVDRNPRVKHRKKYSKAIIKRKSQVRPVTNEITRYDGEKSGVRAFLTRSIKIK